MLGPRFLVAVATARSSAWRPRPSSSVARRRAAIAAALVVALAGGCGGDVEIVDDGEAGAGGSGEILLGSCDTRTMGDDAVIGQCREWRGSTGLDLEAICLGDGGVFRSSFPCLRADVVLSCELAPQQGVTTTCHYYSPPWQVYDAEGHCGTQKKNQ